MRTDEWRLYAIPAGRLRAALADVPEDMPVIMSKGGEGDGHSPLSSVSKDCVYEPLSTWSGEVHDTTDDEYEPDERDVRVVLLGPVN